MTKPLIGVTTSARKGAAMWWCTRLSVAIAGGKAVRITALNKMDTTPCDGYIISGGADIDPQRYGQENTASIDIEPERDALEQRVIEHALAAKKPLLGICRGAQMINIISGGTLHQEARDFYEAFVPTDSVLGKIFARRKIRIIHEGVLYKLFERTAKLSVNSLHHQAIDRLGDELHVSAEDEIGIVQAIEGTKTRDQLILGVQWHPEFMLHSKSHRKLFKVLIAAARST